MSPSEAVRLRVLLGDAGVNAVADFHTDGVDVLSALQGMVLGFANALRSPHSIKDHPITRGTAKDLQPRVTAVLGFLDRQIEMFDALSDVGDNLAKALRACEHVPGKFIDPSLEVTDVSHRAAAVLRQEIDRIAAARTSAFGDSRLGAFDRDRLVGSFYDCRKAAERAVAVVESVVAAIRFHDEACMDQDERGISSLEEMANLLHGEDGRDLVLSLRSAEGHELFSFAGAKRELSTRS